MNRFQRRTNAWGIDLKYQDAFKKWHEASEETVRAILKAMGMEGEEIPPDDDPVLIMRAGESRRLKDAASIQLESGETIQVGPILPSDLPLGYHSLHLEGAPRPKRLIVGPGRCFLPEHLETWGWAVQLYAARSRDSWGIGDFSDLEKLASWSAEKLGAGMMLLNPLSAATPICPQQPSPYYPTSRRFFNPLFIHVDWVAECLEKYPSELDALARAGRELNRDRLIDRDSVFALKLRALELLWTDFEGDDSFTKFKREQGADLDHFATFCTLAELHNSGWQSWPQPYRHPENQAVQQFARQNEQRIEFHKWLQWLIDRQLARSSKHLALMQDLPIGVDPDGADAWAWQDVLAKGMAVGAPPDEFNTQGQNWGLPPFNPYKLRSAGYEPFIQTIRAAFRNGGGLRIDHVMGLFRLYWIPQGMPAQHGTYVRYNADELLAIVALESERAHAYVVGEDLGTVGDEIREKLASYKVMSYRLLWFEKEDPSSYPRDALAAITTHDLPTVAGLWTGSDLEKQNALGLNPNGKGTTEIRERLRRWTGLANGCSPTEVIVKSHAILARAPARILTAALDDAAAVEERPNVPATNSDANPNWCLALPMPIDELVTDELPIQIAAVLRARSGSASVNL
jgi:4-alpha-glucanotransferase